MVDEKKTVLIYKDALKDLDMLTEEQHSAYLMLSVDMCSKVRIHSSLILAPESAM